MYKYFKEVQMIINDYLETIPNDDSKIFYQTRLLRFFEEYMSQSHNSARPLNTINFHDLNTFIDGLEFSNAEKLNYYNAFAGFFRFAYLTDRLSTDVMKGVKKPNVESKPKKYIDRNDIIKIKKFISNSKESIEDRLLIALFLFTGLSRKYIANLTHYQFSPGNIYFSLFFDLGEETRNVPLNSHLVLIVKEYFNSIPVINPYEKLFKYDENYISEKVSAISKKITGKSYTPTDYSNTLIKEALIQSNDVLTVSLLTLESITTIMKHVKIDEQNVLDKQLMIVNRIFDDVDNFT